jgi:hypothetical protein
MYKMPGEVVHAEAPGLFGLTFQQLAAAIGGFLVASWLGLESFWFAVLFAGIGMLVTHRVRGLYFAQRVWGWLRWYYRSQTDTDNQLNPATLYDLSGAQIGSEQGGPRTYIVRRPNGETYTIERPTSG